MGKDRWKQHALLAETFEKESMQICGGNHMAVQFPLGWDVHQVGDGVHPVARLYLHHPVLRDTGAQTLHWRR